ncbi:MULTISPECIES: AbrB/MazE/SpoVT family DNA-binding domain-containing protein [Vibrio]|uniref:AbrB/MazE/SpoVT family DNA-binding domain-containing protein n=1 Tax=Vibrio TaxID=662 RepID=UPI0002EBD277|nr:AbrB/MazE/SpoVT family DNA-binding domain-containing protein [Vibrio cyclitrophicus]OEF33568.1 hypothetical protein OA9_18190 [Vibrio cyclitrophicus 1F97]OEF39061.1 hypothetical protein OAC_02215 [Vibrio cyclitrophicus 1F273]OEF75339.1 hypothetical protein OA5_06145 [Vibrio cyclitrophicus 1F111]PMH32117.1 hypothetical protein BCU72_16955 [Vibrio cyclitrophicus]
MDTVLIKIDGSTGVVIPDELLEEMQLKPGAKVTLVRQRDGFFVKPSNEKPKYKLKDLMANTDFELQRNDPELQEWSGKSIVGREQS